MVENPRHRRTIAEFKGSPEKHSSLASIFHEATPPCISPIVQPAKQPLILKIKRKKLEILKNIHMPPMKSDFGSIKPVRETPAVPLWDENGRKITSKPLFVDKAEEIDELKLETMDLSKSD